MKKVLLWAMQKLNPASVSTVIYFKKLKKSLVYIPQWSAAPPNFSELSAQYSIVSLLSYSLPVHEIFFWHVQ